MARLLVVDDEPAVRDILIAFLSDRGHSVEAAADGRAALALAAAESFGCYFIDIHMPGMNGIETLKELRRRDPAAVVIMISGGGDEALANQALDHGAVDYIGKPFDEDYLDKALRLHLATAG